VKDGQPEKIKCVVCDHRIRIGQDMFERDGGWAHAMSSECGTSHPAPAKDQMTLPADTAPPTKPLEPVPVLSTNVPETSTTQPPIPDTIVEQMIREHPVLATPNPTLAVKHGPEGLNAHVSQDELDSLIAKARTVVMSPEDKEEQRRGFAAANVALDTGRPLDQVRKEVDAAADELDELNAQVVGEAGQEAVVAADQEIDNTPRPVPMSTTLLTDVQNIPPRKRIAFLDDDGVI
jgi:hypothetical protein